MKGVEVVIISGRTSQQGVGLEIGKTSEEYFKSASYIELSERDAKALGVEDGQPVEVTTPHGSVVVTGRVSEGLDSGVIFFPYGLWANQVFGTTTAGTGMPTFKGVRAIVKPAVGKDVKTLAELVDSLRRGG
jgi:formylmethanofuran dehydrogenase subunit D